MYYNRARKKTLIILLCCTPASDSFLQLHGLCSTVFYSLNGASMKTPVILLCNPLGFLL